MSAHILYRFYDSEDRLLYVGLTINPGRRMEKHRNEKPWWSDITRIAFEHHETSEDLKNAERAAIQSEKPIHNIRMNGTSRREKVAALKADGWKREGTNSWRSPDTKDRAAYTTAAAYGAAGQDVLVGRWFHSWVDPAEGADLTYATMRDGRRLEWQGQILAAVDGAYLVQTYSWWDGTANGGAFLVPRDQVGHWTFYQDHEYMQAGLGCREDFGPRRDGSGWPEGVCGRDVTHIIRRSILGPILRCGRCIEFYAGKAEPWPG